MTIITKMTHPILKYALFSIVMSPFSRALSRVPWDAVMMMVVHDEVIM
jgi:hypothetical protein